MKKLLSLFIAISLSCSMIFPYHGAAISADDVTLTTMPKLTIEDISSVDYWLESRMFAWQSPQLSELNFDLLLELLNPENLKATPNAFQLPNKNNGSMQILLKNNRNIHLDPNGVSIYLNASSMTNRVIGYFTYKNQSIYEKLASSMEKLCKEKLEKESNPMPGQAKVSNFKKIYSATFESGLSIPSREVMYWGLCSYNIDKQKEPVIAAWISMDSDSEEVKFYFPTKGLSEKNTLSWNPTSMLVLTPNDSSEIALTGDPVSENFKLQLEVSNDFEVTGATFTHINTYSHTSTVRTLDMSKYKDSGPLPNLEQFPFATEKSENNVKNFKVLYSASFDTGRPIPREKTKYWGLCSYNMDGYNEPIIAAWYAEEPEDSELHFYYCNTEPSEKNTISWNMERLIVIDEDVSFEVFFDEDSMSENYKLHFDVSEDLEVTGATLTYIDKANRKTTVHKVDMSTYKSTGSLKGQSAFPFSPEWNRPNPAPSVTPEPTKTPAPTASAIPTATASPTPKPSETTTPTATTSPTPKPSETATATPAPSQTPEPTKQIFPDVPLNHWAFDSINKFYNAGIVKGYDDGYFGTDDSITYEHFGFLLDRLLGYKDANTTQTPAIREDIIVSVVKALELEDQQVEDSIIEATFSDCHGILSENRKYIAIAIKNDLIIGSDGRLFPKDNLTRAETVVLLDRAIQKAGIIV